MEQYKLLACDLDETTLSSDLTMSENNIRAMAQAIDSGKYVVFTTGRSYLLTKPYIDLVPGMRYALIGTGATGIDVVEDKDLFRTDIDEETTKWILSAAAGYDLLSFLFIGREVLCPTWAADRAEEFHVGKFADSYRRYLDPKGDPFPIFMENPGPVEKVNLMFTNEMEKEMVYEQIQNLPISFTTIAPCSLEINANGVSKAQGLKKLCRHLGIELSECIAIGDSENDLDLIRKAGLGLAVENAQQQVLDAADAIVPSNNNDGLAVAIHKYLLGN